MVKSKIILNGGRPGKLEYRINEWGDDNYMKVKKNDILSIILDCDNSNYYLN